MVEANSGERIITKLLKKKGSLVEAIPLGAIPRESVGPVLSTTVIVE